MCSLALVLAGGVTDRVRLHTDVVAALHRMGPWARHDLRPRPLHAVTVAADLSVYRPRSLQRIADISCRHPPGRGG